VITQSAQTNQRVLVIEDEFYIADSLVTASLAAGLEAVGPAYSVSQVLGQIECTADIHGAILDINLRKQQALPVADALSVRQIPFLITTGYDPQQLEGRYRHIPRFEKPFDPTKAVAKLQKEMASRQG
jgi:DNA-binding NtrC family response regulator